jgi:hypothetical protein
MIPGELCDDSKMRLPRNRAPILGRRFQRHAERAVHARAALAAPGSAPRPGDVACVWHAGVHAKTVAESLEAHGMVAPS